MTETKKTTNGHAASAEDVVAELHRRGITHARWDKYGVHVHKRGDFAVAAATPTDSGWRCLPFSRDPHLVAHEYLPLTASAGEIANVMTTPPRARFW